MRKHKRKQADKNSQRDPSLRELVARYSDTAQMRGFPPKLGEIQFRQKGRWLAQ